MFGICKFTVRMKATYLLVVESIPYVTSNVSDAFYRVDTIDHQALFGFFVDRQQCDTFTISNFHSTTSDADLQHICKNDVDDRMGIVDQMVMGGIEDTQDDTQIQDFANIDLKKPHDRDTLQAEAILLESAIRERMHVSRKMIDVSES